MNIHHLEVQGISCGGCVKRVKSALEPIKGVNSVDVDLHAGRVDVSGDLPDGADSLVLALTAAGYPAKLTSHTTAAAPIGKKSGGCCG